MTEGLGTDYFGDSCRHNLSMSGYHELYTCRKLIVTGTC